VSAGYFREKLVEMEQLDPPYAGLENPDISIDRVFTSPGRYMNRIYPKMIIYGREPFLPQALVRMI